MTRRPGPVLVAKFGGASLARPERVAEYVRGARRRRQRLVLVISAREGVTDLLLRAVARPHDVRLHRAVERRLARAHPNLSAVGRHQLERLGRLLRELERRRSPDPPGRDRLLSLGERLAVHWLAAYLLAEGIPAAPVEADHLGLITDNAYGASCLRIERSGPAVRRGLGRLLARGAVPVVTGYFGRSLEGRVATLGRGGSDYAATGIAAILGAPRVELVKRDVSVFSADPREVPGARPLRTLSYEEAEELAQFGARVLHPLTIEPARVHGIELVVWSLEHPNVRTTIGPANARRRNRALTLLRGLRLFRLRVPGGRQRPGVVAEVAEHLRRSRVNVVQLFTSSALLCLVVDAESAAGVGPALRPLTRESQAMLDGPYPVSLVTVIGDRVLDDLHRLPAEAVSGALGLSATARALSLAVPETRGPGAVRALHRSFIGRSRG